MEPVLIGIRQNDNFIVIDFIEIEIVSDPCAER